MSSLKRWAWVCAVGALLPSLVLLSIWLPVLRKYTPGTPTINAAAEQALLATPTDAVLAEIARQRLEPDLRLASPAEVLAAAEAVLDGRLMLPGYPGVALGDQFRLDLLEHNAETLGLLIGSLVDIRIVLDAQQLSPSPRFLDYAVRRFSEFSAAEAGAWLPHGFLWNDHAIAARISVAAQLWLATRADPARASLLAPVLARQVSRSMRLLADARQYTYATNHGVMQNLGLLQAAAAFPALPESRPFAQLAIERLRAQLGHYLGTEGMVLEHSAGYHKHGVEMLDMAQRAAALAGSTGLADLAPRVDKARAVLALLTRPDGSLPRFGNTDGGPGLAKPAPAPIGLSLLPVAGYAVWRSPHSACGDGGTQLVMAASRFPGHGHKLADEGSVMLWAGGVDWLDNTGYWPYGRAGREAVDGWRGSNAPHVPGEPARQDRVSRLTWSGADQGLLFLAFERRGAASLSRQVLAVDEAHWLILDELEAGQGAALETQFSLPVGQETTDITGRRQRVKVGNCRLDFQWLEEAPQAQHLFGSLDPFGGWRVTGGQVIGVTAIARQSPRYLVTLVSLQPADAPELRPLGAYRHDAADDWVMSWHGADGTTTELSRRGAVVQVKNSAGLRRLELSATPDPTAARSDIAASLDRLSRMYPKYRDYLPWRIEMSRWLSVLAVVTFAALALVAVLWHRRVAWIGTAAAICWGVLALWLNCIYFA